MSLSILARRTVVVLSSIMLALGVVLAAGGTAQAAPPPPPRPPAPQPMPAGGTGATLVIVNNTGWPLTLDWMSTGTSAGSSDPVRWITPPPGRVMMNQRVTVRAWTPNMWMMSVKVGYSVNYRQAVMRWTAGLGQTLGNTMLNDTGASPGHQVNARVLTPSPTMSAVYFLR